MNASSLKLASHLGESLSRQIADIFLHWILFIKIKPKLSVIQAMRIWVRFIHGPYQSGPYSRVRDLLATFTLNFSLIAKRSSAAKSRGAQGIDRLAALG